MIPRNELAAPDGSDAGAWVRRDQRATPAARAGHPGQRWPKRDPCVPLAGYDFQDCQYWGSREGGLDGLELPGELPMRAARRTSTRPRFFYV